MTAVEAHGPSDAHSRYLQTGKFASLDGLRAVSILAVIWHHTVSPLPGWPITGRGFLGVDLFFIISGFLIVTLLLRERARTGGISLRDFYVRRVLRIFPPYFLMLLVVGAAAVLKPGDGSALNLRELPYAALFASNLVPMHGILAITWSLATEEQFYLLVPALEKYVRRALPVLLASLYLLSILPPFGFFAGIQLPVFFRETTFGPILLGVGLAHALHDRRGFEWISRTLAWKPASVLALGLVILVASYPAEDISGWPRLTTHWSLAILLASCVISERNGLRPVLALWPMRRIGAVSYGIYLYHLIVAYFVSWALKTFGISWHMASFFATAACGWAAAEISYRFYEKRFLAMKERFAHAGPH
jgi:peptidoglycan/LPS O-acetylase OafA/YrhL